MKSITSYLGDKANDKYWNAIQISILIGIFSYYFAENFVLSEGWDVLVLRSIDDFAMNDSIRQMQKALISGDWKRVFTFFDYGYGNIFWLANAIFLLPLQAIGDSQIQIVVGRQLSLLFVFGSIYLVGLIIDWIQPDAKYLKYPILISIATMPMIAIIGTKLHVNAQCLFFGILAFYFIVRGQHIDRKGVICAGVFSGVAVGLKITGLFIMPLLGLTLMSRLWQRGDRGQVLKGTATFCVVFLLVAAAGTAPTLLLFPMYSAELKATYGTFMQFKSMGAPEGGGMILAAANSAGFYLSAPALSAVLVFYAVLICDDLKKNKYTTVFMVVSFFSAAIFLLLTVDKEPAYAATYILSLGFFIPLGLLGIEKVPGSRLAKVAIIYAIIILSLLYGAAYRDAILEKFQFFMIAKSEKVRDRLQALSDMRGLIMPLQLPVRVLQDATTLFPGTMFSDGIVVIHNFGTLREYSMATWGRFDFIVLNSKEYFGKNEKLEMDVRRALEETGVFYGLQYSLIYKGHDTLLYKLSSH